MNRIMAIDFGLKKTGLAVTDPLRIIVTGLTTVATKDLFSFLDTYFKDEPVGKIVLGEPLYPDGNPAQLHSKVLELKAKLAKKYPDKSIVLQDERFTSERAKKIIFQSGIKKKKRRDKSLIDKVSAVLILEDYLGIY